MKDEKNIIVLIFGWVKEKNDCIAKFALGTMGDDRTGCVSVVNGRRVGICEDGVYTITTKHTDTSGNTNAGFVKTVERDTVAPEIPSS